MKRPRSELFPVAALALTVAFFNSPCYSQGKYELSSQAQEQLTAVQDLMQRNEFQNALDVLNKLRTAVRSRSYDQAVTYQTIGYVNSTLGKNQEATQAFISAINTGALPPDAGHELEYTVAQLLIADASYADGMKYLTAWFRNEKNPPPEAHYLAATAYYFLEDYKQLVYQARNAVNKRADAPSSWYEMLLAGYYETDDMTAAADLLETMLKKFPARTQYWMQLAGIYLTIRKNEQALALMELAYLKGLIKQQQELMQLAQTYLYLGMPYKAATLISSEMAKNNIKKSKETVMLLADSWFLARETATGIEVLTDAVNQFKDAEVYYRLGQLYVEREDWDNAVKILNQTTQMSDFKDIADAYLLLGVAALHGNDKATSYRALNNALKYDTTRKQAQQWLAELK